MTPFHVITSDGIDTFVHLKPVELFKRILEKYGPDSRQVNSFLSIHGTLEVCVMSLILLADDKIIDSSIKVFTFYSV